MGPKTLTVYRFEVIVRSARRECSLHPFLTHYDRGQLQHLGVRRREGDHTMNIALWVLQILFAALFMLHAVLHLFPSPRLKRILEGFSNRERYRNSPREHDERP
jgi:hypothetical protein